MLLTLLKNIDESPVAYQITAPIINVMMPAQPPFLPVDILDPELDEKPPPPRRSSTLLLSLRPSNFIILRFYVVCKIVFFYSAANV
jgi:hypothetical protein